MIIKEEKIKAFELRRKGKSYNQIASILGISKSTISGWLKDVNWSQDIRDQLIEKSKENSRTRLINLNSLRQDRFEKYYLKAEKEAAKEFNQFKNDKLFIAALSLYWGEGDKVFKNGIVRISNVDGKLLKIFKDFLQKICLVSHEKIKGNILLYPDLGPKECLKFWSQEIGITEENFFKPTIIQGKHQAKRLGYGVCIVATHNKYLKKKILVWLDLFKEEF
jgi:predicted transcriptional regulator